MIGIDIVDIERFRDIASKKGFIEKNFTAEEIEYAKKYEDFKKHLAGMWALKEAAKKATSIIDPIHIIHDSIGVPSVHRYDTFLGTGSISYTDTIAVAVFLW